MLKVVTGGVLDGVRHPRGDQDSGTAPQRQGAAGELQPELSRGQQRDLKLPLMEVWIWSPRQPLGEIADLGKVLKGLLLIWIALNARSVQKPHGGSSHFCSESCARDARSAPEFPPARDSMICFYL